MAEVALWLLAGWGFLHLYEDLLKLGLFFLSLRDRKRG